MAQVMAGHRAIYRAYGIAGELPKLSARLRSLSSGKRQIPEVWVYLDRYPLGTLTRIQPPRWIIAGTTLADLELSPFDESGVRTGGGPPLFAEIVARKLIDIDAALHAQWVANPNSALEALDRNIGKRIHDELRPYVVLAAGIVALKVGEGAVIESLGEYHTFWVTDTNFLSLCTSDICETLPVRSISKAEFRSVVEDLAYGAGGTPERVAAFSLASHWFLEGRRLPIGTDKFLAHFLVLEVLSWLAVASQSSKQVGKIPWSERQAQLKALEDAIKRTRDSREKLALKGLEKRLREIRYAEPSLLEAFGEVARQYSEISTGDRRVFRELTRIRNHILHGRRSEPPESIDGGATYELIENLARKVLQLVLEKEIAGNRGTINLTVQGE